MKLSGVMPALITPFDANGKVDFKAYEKHLTAPARCRCRPDGSPMGSTGEYSALSNAER